MDESLTFYALTVNGEITSIHLTKEDLLKELSNKPFDNDKIKYGIETLIGIWDLIWCYSYMGSRDDDEWMKNVLDQVTTMINEKREIARKGSKKTSPTS